MWGEHRISHDSHSQVSHQDHSDVSCYDDSNDSDDDVYPCDYDDDCIVSGDDGDKINIDGEGMKD